MKTFYVDLRWTNPGEVKYLIDSWSFGSFMEAFYHAQKICENMQSEHFVEIRDNTNNTPLLTMTEFHKMLHFAP